MARISNFRRTPRVIIDHALGETCQRHGAFINAQVEQFDGSFAQRGCVRCRWEGLHNAPLDSDDYRQALASRNAENLNAMLVGSGITPRFRDCTLTNFRAERNAKQAQALAVCKAYVDQFEENFAAGRCLLLLGNVGTGKTHLATGMVHQVIRQHGASALITTAAEIIRIAKASMSRAATHTETDVIDELAEPDLLVLDEVGAQGGTEYERGLLHEVIDRRYQLVLPTIVASNLAAEALKDYIGDRAMDRLRQNGGQAIGFTWDSARRYA